MLDKKEEKRSWSSKADSVDGILVWNYLLGSESESVSHSDVSNSLPSHRL